jgi:sporulation protein YlmC with PRC-barrel domain
MPGACAGVLLIGGAIFAGAWAAADCRDPAACTGTADCAMPSRGPLLSPGPGETMASTLIGAAVIDRQGERLGTVSDAVLSRDLRVVALAVRVGWVLGVTTRTVAVPIGSIHPEADRATEVADGQETQDRPEGGLAATLDALMAGGAPGRGDGRGERLVSDLTRAELLAAPAFEAR